MSIGIICEYNPFHNGHLYQIDMIKKKYPDALIVAIMSGDFTQRGDFSLIDKWKKTEIALEFADLVIELPFVFAVQSADIFAKGAVDIAKALNIDMVIFGSECDDIKLLEDIVLVQESDKYNKLVLDYLDKGFNYPTSLSLSLVDIYGKTVSSPNDLLALEYIRNLKKAGIKYESIKRTNNYHALDLDDKIVSATAIREALRNNLDIKNYIPYDSSLLSNLHFFDDYFDLLKYKIISEDDLSRFQTVDEGIENRLKKCIYECDSLNEFINKVKTKRYTYNKLKRMMLHILCGFTKKEALKFKALEYIRPLGFNDKGRIYLKQIKDKCPLPIINKWAQGFDMLSLELRVANIYNIKEKDDTAEYKHKPIIR